MLVRRSSKLLTVQGLELEWMTGDLRDETSLHQACAGIDVVYHTAAYYPADSVPVEQAVRQALSETRTLIHALRKAAVDRFVFVSTLTTIGFPLESNRLADETCAFSTKFQNNPYLMAKVAMEEEILAEALKGLPAVVVVPTAFFGPYDQKPTSGMQILMIAQGQMPVYVQGPVNVIDVRDVAVAMIHAAQRGRIGERYIVGNWNTTQNDLNTLIASVVGVTPPKISVPFVVARYGAKAGEWFSRRILRKRPAVPAFFVEMLQHMQHYDCTKGMRTLKYPLSSVEGAIRDAVKWFKENNYVS